MINIDDIKFVSQEAYKRSGLVLSTDKGYLLESVPRDFRPLKR